MLVVDQASKPTLREILERYPAHRSHLISLLQDIQSAYGYLSPESIDELSARIGLSANEIFGIATFYAQFHFDPPAKHTIQVCQGTACHVRGSQEVLEELQRELGIENGSSTENGEFSLERIACLGCCALSPVISVDGQVYGGVTPKKVRSILARYRS
jgi:NADH:ubiquinone oxidoreductase subunit E